MKRFERPNAIAGLKVGELRVKEIGRSPSVIAKIAFITEHGESAGQFLLHQFSSRSNELLQALLSSVEDDAIETLSAYAGNGEGGEQEFSNDGEYDGDSDLLS